jgi:hypothetical protein
VRIRRQIKISTVLESSARSLSTVRLDSQRSRAGTNGNYLNSSSRSSTLFSSFINIVFRRGNSFTGVLWAVTRAGWKGISQRNVKSHKTDKTEAVKHSLYYAGRKRRAAQLTHVAGNRDIMSDYRVVIDDHICFVLVLVGRHGCHAQTDIRPHSEHFSQWHLQAFRKQLSRHLCELT